MSNTKRSKPHFIDNKPWEIKEHYHPSLKSVYAARNERQERKVRKDHVKDGYVSKPMREPNPLGTLGWAEIEGKKNKQWAKKLHRRYLRILGKKEIDSQLKQEMKDFEADMKELLAMEYQIFGDLYEDDDYRFEEFDRLRMGG
jgi:hypothetical protein